MPKTKITELKTLRDEIRKRRDTLGRSDKVLASAVDKRKLVPMMVSQHDLGSPKYETIRANDLLTLRIDERYQREKITAEAHKITHALKAGGVSPQPVIVSERPDGTRWIVDGQQRWWAHMDCAEPLLAQVFRIADWHVEAKLFQILQDRVAIVADTLVKGHPGATASLILDRASRETSPYFGHVSFGNNSRATYGAAILAKGILAAVSGIGSMGSIRQVLSRSDFGLQQDDAMRRAELMLLMIPLVFPPALGRVRFLPMIALGRVAYRRFSAHPALPPARVYERLKRINWMLISASSSKRFLINFEQAIERRWPENAR